MATKKKINKFHSKAGFSLVELLIGLGVSSLAALACYDIVNKSSQNYLTIAAASENIVETLEAATALKRKISLAVNLERNLGPILPSVRLTKGQLISFDPVWNPSNGDGQISVVFSGFIDSLKSNYQVLPSSRFERFLPMVVFFQRPTVDKYGVIYITIGEPGSTSLTPREADFIFRQIVDFKIKNIDSSSAANNNRVSKFDLEITRRSYKQTTNNFNYKWCPPDKMNLTECRTAPAYTDSTEYTTIVLRNNVLARSSQKQKIYKPTGGGTPAYVGIPKRLVSGVYFLDSVQPAASVKR